MATSHELLALEDDFNDVLRWLTDRGAVRAGSHPQHGTLVLHFPEFGPLETRQPHAHTNFKEGSPDWKAAFLAGVATENDPIPRVNQLTSAAAGAVPPLRDARGFWWSSSIWFGAPKLRDRFPDLARLNGQLERWIRKSTLAFDNTTRTIHSPFGDQLGGFEGIIRKVYALPSAQKFLVGGGTFVAYGTSDKVLGEFLRRRELSGNPVA
jgi:hypothetical protein